MTQVAKKGNMLTRYITVKSPQVLGGYLQTVQT